MFHIFARYCDSINYEQAAKGMQKIFNYVCGNKIAKSINTIKRKNIHDVKSTINVDFSKQFESKLKIGTENNVLFSKNKEWLFKNDKGSIVAKGL